MIFHRTSLSIACAALVAFLSADRASAADPVTFTKDVAPIFFKHCVNCHRPNQIAPMSLLSFEEARPWAKAIAREVSLRNMPPWSGDSENHKWSNDISLNDDQIATITAWVEQGTKRGNPTDLPTAPTFPEKWANGEPDYIITLDTIDVPADGEDIFPKLSAIIDIDEPKWIRSIEFLPGDRRVAHHSLVTYNSPTSGQGTLAVWTAGMPPYVFPEGMGRVIGPGTKIQIDAHYHPYGEATSDQTQIGLYFGEGDIQKEVATVPVTNTGLRIPPGASNHTELAFYDFTKDMQIVAFSPHLHVRGKAMRYDIVYPDGREEMLLDVPKYNFNWQWLYYPEKPIEVPAGSRVNVTATWDNSADNPSNPDPTKEIIYRGDTFNEMFVGFLELIPSDGTYHEIEPATKTITELLAKHEEGTSFLVGGFLPFGIYAPKEGEGWIYLAQGMVMFTITLDNFEWNGNQLTVHTEFPTLEASAAPATITGTLDDQGRLKGMLEYALVPTSPLKVPIVATPVKGTKVRP